MIYKHTHKNLSTLNLHWKMYLQSPTNQRNPQPTDQGLLPHKDYVEIPYTNPACAAVSPIYFTTTCDAYPGPAIVTSHPAHPYQHLISTLTVSATDKPHHLPPTQSASTPNAIVSIAVLPTVTTTPPAAISQLSHAPNSTK